MMTTGNNTTLLSTCSSVDDPGIIFCPFDTELSGGPYFIKAADFNCSMWDFCCCPVLEADPDIAGLGVSTTVHWITAY